MNKRKLQVCFIRHGESIWNKENRFTGWYDIGLSQTGIKEAQKAGKLLKENDYSFDMVYTSFLKRSIMTHNYLSEQMNNMYLPVYRSWRLNERHYGALTGLNKKEMMEQYGEEKVKIWRRSADIPPPILPSLPIGDNDIKKIENELKEFGENKYLKHSSYYPQYKNVPNDCLPLSESLNDTIKRVLPIWHDSIANNLLKDKKVLVVAHGNSLRGIIKHIEKISDKDIINLNIPTGVPIIYNLNEKLEVMDKVELKI